MCESGKCFEGDHRGAAGMDPAGLQLAVLLYTPDDALACSHKTGRPAREVTTMHARCMAVAARSSLCIG